MTTAVFADTEGLLRDWVNSLTSTLVGPGHPLPLGAWLDHPGGRTPLKGAYVFLTAGNGDDRFLTGAGVVQTVNGQVYGPTRKAAVDAAVAYAEALRSLYAGNVAVAATAARPAAVLGLDFVTAPLWAPDRSTARYLVDASLIVTPTP